MKTMKKIVRVLLVVTLMGIFVLLSVSGAEAGESAPRVLFISSYSYSWPTIPQQIRGIEKAIGGGALLDIHFMNTKEVNMKTDGEEVYSVLKSEIEMVEPYNAVIAGDDDALHFADTYRKELFPEIPIVFLAVEDIPYAERLSEDPYITGILEQTDYEDNIRLIRKLFPETKKLTAIVDNTTTGYAAQQQFMEQRTDYPEFEFSMINASELSEEELKESISGCDENTVLFYLIMTEDRSGRVYTNSQACSLICSSAQVPVMRCVQAGIGEGVLGGRVVLMEKAGELAGKMVMEILGGTDPSSIALQESSPENYSFDYQVMKRFGLKKSQLPSGAEIVHDEESFFRRYAVSILTILLFLTILCIILIERSRKQLSRTKKLMEKMVLKDQLTGCYTRYYLQTQLIEEDTGNWREKDRKYSVAIIDIDHFKSINDIYGHTIGDDILCEISQILLNSCKEENGDCVLRYFGDEFVILYSDVDIHELKRRLQFILDKTEKIKGDHKEQLIWLNIGAELCTQDHYRYQELLDSADRKIYRSREKGKNGFTI